jgi:hypothetical protein
MELKKPIPLVLLLFTVMCVLPATTAVIPSAIAQEEDDDMSLDEAENLASDTVSNVLDNGNTAGDSANTQVSVPLTDQDQTDANLGLSEVLDVTVERTLSTPTTPPPDDDGELPPEEEPPEFTVFCVEGSIFGTACFDTLEECEDAVGIGIIGGGGCEGFESPPPGGRDCVVLRDPIGQPVGVFCPL